MARYLMLLRHGPTDFDGLTDADFGAMLDQFTTWTDELAEAGRLVTVQRLKPGGRTLRQRDRLVVDGPYAEAKEAVVGLYVVEADDYDHAAQLAESCPCVRYNGVVELRECEAF